ncbi:hypothetical protein CCY99_03990 [Helicobacter sp. 16-1353]|nr:hypothetical protein CCY99_03990 [Helicobacter sp. 16-1353]
MRFSSLLPFFATLLLAAWFFYFQWSSTKFRTIDFQKIAFYGKDYIFSPIDEEYIMVLYNSKSSDIISLTRKIPNETNLKIIAIDFYQNRDNDAIDNIIPLSAGMDTLLQLSNKFKITKLPVYFKIKRESVNEFIQDSKIINIKLHN